MNTPQPIISEKMELFKMEPEKNRPAEFNYHCLNYALKKFSKNISQLDAGQYTEIMTMAAQSYDLESQVIASDEASGVVISEEQLQQSMNEVSSRYQSKTEFINDLKSNSLDEASLKKALYRELLFDSVMQRVIALNSSQVSETDIGIFYELHRKRFESPEKRQASHILITINPDFPENTVQAAKKKIEEIEQKLNGRTNRFKDFASRYSECPSAMEGGKLGEIVRGQLYPQLDAELFAMQENEISQIIESEMGFHILYCEKIKPAFTVPLAKAAERIRETLQARNDRECQKNWLAGLNEKNKATDL